MWVERMRLFNWRNFCDEVVSFQEGVNALCGDNGAGKTNCLEAIAYLSRGTSFRNASLQEMRRAESTRFLLEVIFHSEGVQHRLSLTAQEGVPIAHFNGQRIRQWRGLIPTVLWLPQDAELVRGSPTLRRRFLDDHLHQCDPLYTHHWVRYHRFLKQRNHLLKQRRVGELGPWNEGMAKAGGHLCSTRAALIANLSDLLRGFFSSLNKTEEIDLRYRPALKRGMRDEEGADSEDSSSAFAAHLLATFEAQMKEEVQVGTTLYGPHRDDFEVIWDHRRARHFVSNGQAKLCSAGFKVAEWRRLNQMGQNPVLLIDEFGSGLDEEHQKGIWRAFSPAPQILAACSTLQRKSLDALLQTPYRCTRVRGGIFTQEG